MCRFVVMLLGLFIFPAAAAAGESDIGVSDAGGSWMSTENLTSLLEVSLNLSRCCNVYVSGKSRGTENIFKKFLKTYPYGHIVNIGVSDCNGYFMISESVDSLITDIRYSSTITSTTEFLVVVDDDVDDSSGIFDVSMYKNANVNVAAPNGLWTLSENYLRPRIFKKTSSINEMVHKKGIVDLEGRKLHGAAMFKPPLCYLQTTVNRTVNGVEAKIFEAKKQSELDGVELKLFMLLAERLNFTWTLRQPDLYNRYGCANKTHWNGGLIGMLFRKEVDIAFTDIWLTYDGYRFASMTTPWHILDIRFLVPRPKPCTSFWALTRPLSPETWFAIIAMVVLQSVYVYTSAWIGRRVTKRFQSFAVTWTEVVGRLIGTWVPRIAQGLKIQFQLWDFAGILLVTAYSSSLAASLTNLTYEKRIDTPRDFMNANLTWGRRGSLPGFEMLFDERDRYGKRFRNQYEVEANDEDRHKKILRGNYAIIGFTIGSIFFPEDVVRPEDYKHFRVMKHQLSKFYTTFAVHPWLLRSADKVMLWLKEGGLVHYHVHDVLHRRTGNALREVMIEHDGYVKGARVLKLTPLAAGFSMLIVGLLVSTVVFFIELYSFSRKSSIRKALLDIQKNHDIHRVMELDKKFGCPIAKS